MIDYIDEPVSVEIETRNDGKILPLGFSWNGRHYRIETWGRDGVEVRDGRSLHCYLVQTANSETWELCQDTDTAQWRLMRHWAVRHQAV
jgi:hypothetical protein